MDQRQVWLRRLKNNYEQFQGDFGTNFGKFYVKNTYKLFLGFTTLVRTYIWFRFPFSFPSLNVRQK